MTFTMIKRRAVYVYLKNMRYANMMRKFGDVTYTSRKMNFVMLYLDDAQVDNTVEQLYKYKFVRKVLISPKPDINPDLDNVHDAVFFENYVTEGENADASGGR